MSAFTKVLVVVVLVLSAGFSLSQIMLFNRREDYGKKYVDAAKQLGDTQAALTKAQAEGADWKNKYETTQGTLQNANDVLTADLARQKTAVAQLNASLTSEQTNVKTLSDTVQAQLADIQARDQVITTLKDSVAKLDQTVKDNVAKIDTLNGNIKDQLAKIGDLDNQLLDVKKERARLAESEAGLKAIIGDLVRRGIRVTSLGPVPPIAGKLVRVDTDLGAAVVNKGSDDRVAPNTEFTIYRDSQYVGSLVIHDVQKDLSVGRVTMLAPGQKIEVGDDATTEVQ
jgi:hypothetical protein